MKLLTLFGLSFLLAVPASADRPAKNFQLKVKRAFTLSGFSGLNEVEFAAKDDSGNIVIVSGLYASGPERNESYRLACRGKDSNTCTPVLARSIGGALSKQVDGEECDGLTVGSFQLFDLNYNQLEHRLYYAKNYKLSGLSNCSHFKNTPPRVAAVVSVSSGASLGKKSDAVHAQMWKAINDRKTLPRAATAYEVLDIQALPPIEK